MDKISALMDGELNHRQAHEQYARLKQDGGLANGWDTYHVIGDALRGDTALSVEFSRRMADRLSSEPTILAPRRGAVRQVARYALSAAASVAAVALVGWVAFVGAPLEVAQAPTSPAPAATQVAGPGVQLASVPSDGKMNEYLIAHQEFSPSTSIQGVAPYIRTVSSSQDRDR
jgi:sigma-E factor negative regulatory protein RseA